LTNFRLVAIHPTLRYVVVSIFLEPGKFLSYSIV